MHVLFLNLYLLGTSRCYARRQSLIDIVVAALIDFWTLSDALQIVARTDGSASVVQLPIQRRSTFNPQIPERLSKRGSVNVDLHTEVVHCNAIYTM